ncbi:GntR family transcriptional regulator [Sphaerisporangium melleum]|uniref:GntR family transcriptional regulator n=1 Tax=Sphaerisporangium melleum TaxID=321316 RepID=A0A917R2W2_9ACTN|nr:GntR family transcriptional regulator [Sphaerisporangium melleum]GGK84750.1 GntR family transcriptional regulator [Sphaerisporangium melleum]GII70444.1 GntR family transcriptional regulator [Sphaerisporangium melleum]
MSEDGGGPRLPVMTGRQSLREQVAQALRDALVAAEMRPGVVYSAPVLAAQFGVSATPVREAMLDLAKEGLVEAVRNKGFRVTELSERDLDELTEIRRLLEVPTVTRLAGTCPPEDIERLRPVAEEMVAAAERGDLLAYVNADLRFHMDLLGLAGNAHLVELARDLRYRARLYGLRTMSQRGTLAGSAREHLDILSALARGDAEATRTLMDHHIQHVRGIWADRPE